ncbi:MAG: hypothetical protein PHW50_01630, partial [Patescibacteria group bacterium]|nr:hypothetical protein [Patescibacteria group bacterium]
TNFDYQVDSFSIEGARGALTKVNTLEEILSSQQKDQYFLKIEAGLLHIFISPGTITANDNTPLVAKFSFKANAESASACIDSDVSKVKWGTWGEEETDGAFINDPIYEQILASRCYTIASPDIPSQGDIYVQNQSDLDLRASVAVVGNNITQATGEWATLKGYNFKVRTQSEKEKFSNELIGIANYLANERPNNVESLIVADSVNINVADNSGKLIIVQSVDSGGFDLNLVGSNQVGQAVGAIIIGGNANFVNVGSLKQFNGVLIVLSRDGIGGTINLNSNAMGVDSFTIRGSLVANQFNPGVNLILSQFHRTNYLNNIPGLAPILDKIYSFYSF